MCLLTRTLKCKIKHFSKTITSVSVNDTGKQVSILAMLILSCICQQTKGDFVNIIPPNVTQKPYGPNFLLPTAENVSQISIT